MDHNLENLTIGAFAKMAGVNVETIRFYQRKGCCLNRIGKGTISASCCPCGSRLEPYGSSTASTYFG